MLTFRNKFAQKVYKYLYIHNDETILLKDMASEIGICDKTCRKYIRMFERRGYIKKTGKHFEILPA